MRYGDRRRPRPFDAWDPYRDDPAPNRRDRFALRRLLRLAIPIVIACSALGHDLWHLFKPDHPVLDRRGSDRSTPQQPALTADRPEPADPRTTLPRPAKPADNPRNWISSDDYPPSAARENQQGSVTFRFKIMQDGRVRDCTIARSSGSTLLDSTACGIFTLHARYWPARDAAGKAISETRMQTVKWQLSED